MREIPLPQEAARLIWVLEAAGHAAYVVGGCVRDSLLGRAPEDWDLCTSALPEEIFSCLGDVATVLPTGLKHGTVTVLWEGCPFELTTFRTEGSYSDHRRPDSVAFVRSLEQDLARRDFTVNAMAWNPREGLVDPFGGQDDLAAGLIRCVGAPERRFEEDALRILRAARFSSTTGFAVEETTKRAALCHAPELLHVAPERLCAELLKLLCGQAAAQALRDFAPLIFTIIPELAATAETPQHTPHHCCDVWEHTVRAVGFAPPEPLLRLTMLLHDIAKPARRTTDILGVDHFKGHPEAGVPVSDTVLRRLRLDNASRERVLLLIQHHDVRTPPKPRAVRRMLFKLGEEALRQLLPIQRADTLAQSEYRRSEKLTRIDGVEACLNQIIAERQCVSLADLAIKGGDLAALGIPAGPEMGAILAYLLEQVIDEQLPNDYETLLREAERLSGGFA